MLYFQRSCSTMNRKRVQVFWGELMGVWPLNFLTSKSHNNKLPFLFHSTCCQVALLDFFSRVNGKPLLEAASCSVCPRCTQVLNKYYTCFSRHMILAFQPTWKMKTLGKLFHSLTILNGCYCLQSKHPKYTHRRCKQEQIQEVQARTNTPVLIRKLMKHGQTVTNSERGQYTSPCQISDLFSNVFSIHFHNYII